MATISDAIAKRSSMPCTWLRAETANLHIQLSNAHAHAHAHTQRDIKKYMAWVQLMRFLSHTHAHTHARAHTRTGKKRWQP